MTQARGSTRSLTEGALLAALAVLLVLMAQFLPLVGSVVVFLWPVPIIVVVLRHGFRTGVLTVITAGLVLSAVVGVIQGLLVALGMGAPGLVFGWGWSRNWSAGPMLLAASCTLLGVTLIMLFASRLLLAIDPLALSFEAMERSLQASIALYERMGLAEQVEMLREMVALMEDFIPLVLPAGLVMASVVHAYLNFTVARGILRRLHYPVPSLPSFAQWKLPFYALLIYAVSATTLLLVPQGPIVRVATNVYYFFNIVFMVQGASLAYYFLQRWQIPRGLAVAMIVLSFFSLIMIYMLAGIAEVAFDIRKAVEKRDEARHREAKSGKKTGRGKKKSPAGEEE